MNFGPHHYVPVLKVKRGEKAALLAIAPALRPRMTPLFEIVERNPERVPTVARHLDTAFKDLPASAALFDRIFLDAREIAADGETAAKEVFERAAAAGMRFVPVTGLHRTADLKPALAHQDRGLVLRLTRQEFETGNITSAINAFMTQHSLVCDNLDLVVDLGAVDDMIADGVANLTAAFLADVPVISKWRTLTVSACAFPKSMGGVERNASDLVDRAEWLAWRDELYADRGQLKRLPTYSDCVIQYPAGVEGFDPRIMAASAAIRYALSEEWLLIKGESTRKISSSVQFPKLARELVYGQFSTHFMGADHCAGCASMKAAADGAKRLGSPEVWRRLGTIHHMTLTVESLAALPWP